MLTEFIPCEKCGGVCEVDKFKWQVGMCENCFNYTNLGFRAGDRSDQQHLNIEEGPVKLSLPAPIL